MVKPIYGIALWAIPFLATSVFSMPAQPNMKPSEFFHQLNSQSMHLVDKFYSKNATLVDPLGSVTGSENIKKYYAYQYKHIDSLTWKTEPEIVSGKTQILVWTMNLKTKALNSGNEFSVDGISKFRFNEQGQVEFHQDYFDVGAFIYERLPILKNAISFIKGRMRHGLDE